MFFEEVVLMRPLHDFRLDDPCAQYDALLTGGSICLAPAAYTEAMATEFGLVFSTPTREAIRRMWVAISVLDWVLDAGPNRAMGRAIFNDLMCDSPAGDNLPNWVHEGTAQVAALLRSALTEIGSIAEARKLGAKIADFGPKKAPVWFMPHYIRLARHELMLTAQLALCCLSPEERSHPSYCRFRAWLTQAVVASGMRDHYRDRRGDYENGIMVVKPNRFNGAVLWSYKLWAGIRLGLMSPRKLWAAVCFVAEFDSATAYVAEPAPPT